ncbi:MAG: RNase adaptor protein RapZ, partial [Acidimicrobiia bacterium]|nr:RNase adaptor protein RapZ [Acidimicrobiia bacterium]
FEREGRAYLSIGIGCTGGHHRSVAIAEALALLIGEQGYPPQVRHRDVDRD